MKQGRLTVGIIGSDVAGVAIAQALQEAGHLVIARTATEFESVDRIEAVFPTAKQLSEAEVCAEVDLVLLAIKHDQITKLVQDFADRKLWRGGQLVVHTAYEYGHEVLSPATMQGVIPLAISPAMRFTGTSIDLARFKESYFAVSAPQVALPIAEALVIEMGAEPIVVLDANRKAFAEAITVAGNFSAMIVNQAIGLLEQAAVENPALVLSPVVRSAVDQALSRGHRQIDPEDLIGEP